MQLILGFIGFIFFIQNKTYIFLYYFGWNDQDMFLYDSLIHVL